MQKKSPQKPRKKSLQTAAAKKSANKKSELNPTYVKIGKRIRQARLMAKETNSRDLSLRLGWSAGRINNFEVGISTPGPDETETLAEIFGVRPAWITYGVEPMRSAELYTARHWNLMRVVEEAERAAELPALLEALKLSIERLEKHRASPLKKIPDAIARRCEKYLNKPRGWLDQTHVEARYCEPLPSDMRDLLDIYVKLADEDRRKLYEMGRILLGEASPPQSS